MDVWRVLFWLRVIFTFTKLHQKMEGTILKEESHFTFCIVPGKQVRLGLTT